MRMKNKYKVQLRNEKGIVFKSEVTLTQLKDVLDEYILHAEIRVDDIISGLGNKGTSACWCGSIGLGYKIAKITEDKRYIKYVFGKEDE